MVATVQRLSQTPLDNDDIRSELEELKASSKNANSSWAGGHVVLMTNGEYIAYAFWHGFNNGSVDNLFVAHGTDRKWYYSTYHFCNSMAGILGDDPPGSIREFASRYALREFDGKSDVCLKHTWPTK